jgi:predicted Rossmann fold flavoprotein
LSASFDAIVIGAGAAGMMCAATAGQRGRRVLLVDHATKLGEKIRISGGGRCNFTNLHCAPENFLSRNPHFCRSALARYTPRHFIELVERHGIGWHEKKLGQLFCDDSATRIIDMLRAECEAGGVQWRMPCTVESIARGEGGFELATSAGAFAAPSLVIATGGLSIPKIGASPFGYRVAEQFGMAVVPPRPGLVPLTFDAQELARFGDLAGISADAVASAGPGRFRENLLFTHRGLSGPSILQVSSYWTPGQPIHVDLLPDHPGESLFESHRPSRALPATVLGEVLPRRLAQAWCEAEGATGPMDQMARKVLQTLAAGLHDWRVKPSGTAGYQKAEVTLGGVDTEGLSSRTMEAREVPGLYFIGEVVDVTGWLGGYNFQWAWASGYACAQALAHASGA